MRKYSSKTKLHTVYKTKNGLTVPGASTIAKRADTKSGALIHWAWKLGVEGRDYKKVLDEAGEIGTVGHYLLLCKHKNETPDLTEYSQFVIDRAKNCLDSYHKWEKEHTVKPIVCEKELVSEKHLFGGCMDFYGECDGVKELQDYKTGSGIYFSYLVQAAGYSMLLEEHGYEVQKARILNIPKKEGDKFLEREIDSAQLDVLKKIFLNCLENYYLEKKLEDN